MKIGGLQGVSLIDYPGALSAIVFTIGCNFRCPYCHNRDLVEETAVPLSEKQVLDFLRNRKKVLDAVTITGGEPTMQPDLIPFIQHIRQLGYRVKLDTNGTHPSMVRTLIAQQLIDYIAMDIKAPLTAYTRIAARAVDTAVIKESITLIMKSGLPYEFRTTVVRSLLSPEDIQAIAQTIEGAARYCLQKFLPNNILNPAFIKKTTYSTDEFENIRTRILPYVSTCIIR